MNKLSLIALLFAAPIYSLEKLPESDLKFCAQILQAHNWEPDETINAIQRLSEGSRLVLNALRPSNVPQEDNTNTEMVSDARIRSLESAIVGNNSFITALDTNPAVVIERCKNIMAVKK